MIKVGILGSTGYAGSELLRILTNHPDVKIEMISSKTYEGKKYGDVFENFRHQEDLVLEEDNIEKMADCCDVVFIALPHGLSSSRVNENILSRTKVIDIGADFRIKNIDVYEKWYETKHDGEDILKKSVYGLCEIHREQIKKTNLIANPGCYTTASILALYPLLKEDIIDEKSIIIDAKSGVSGAGRGVNIGVHYNETNENIKAYKIASHRHTPEIEEQLSLAANKKINVLFTPHLTPMNRGILATCYSTPKKDIKYEDIEFLYKKYYGDEYFIRLCKRNVYPETKWVKSSNFCDIGFGVDNRTGKIIVISAIDNLFKGAAGQAVQNMNLLFGIDEKKGIDYIPAFPL